MHEAKMEILLKKFLIILAAGSISLLVPTQASTADAQIWKVIPKPKPKPKTSTKRYGAQKAVVRTRTASKVRNPAVVKVRKANIRSAPSKNADWVITLDTGTKLDAQKICGDWIKVRVIGKPVTGWIYGQLIDATWQQSVSTATNGELNLPSSCPPGF